MGRCRPRCRRADVHARVRRERVRDVLATSRTSTSSAVVEWGIPAAFALAIVLDGVRSIALRRWRDGPLAAAALGGTRRRDVPEQRRLRRRVPRRRGARDGRRVHAPARACPRDLTTQMLRVRAHRAGRGARRSGHSCVMRPSGAACGRPRRPHRDEAPYRSARLLRDDRAAPPARLLRVWPGGPAAARGGAIPRGVEFLNQALRLHPYHPGLHRLGRAPADRRSARNRSGGLEYSLAMKGRCGLTRCSTRSSRRCRGRRCRGRDPDGLRLTRRRPQVAHRARARRRRRALAGPRARPKTHDLGLLDELYALAIARNDLDVALRRRSTRMQQANTRRRR